MDTGVMVVSGAAASLLACTLVGGPMVLADWVRMRRQAVIARQIALTEALDAQFGPLVAPVVTKPLFGPWEVRIDVPLLASAVLTRIIAVTDQMFAGVEGTPRYPTVWSSISRPRPGVRYRTVGRAGRQNVGPGHPSPPRDTAGTTRSRRGTFQRNQGGRPVVGSITSGGGTIMFIHEQLALQMAQERMAEAVRWAEQRRALRLARPAVRIRLGRTLVWLGHCLADQPSTALSSHPNPVWGLPMARRR